MSPTNPDLLKRIAALDISEREFLRRCRVSTPFLARAKKGESAHPGKSYESWERIRKQLAIEEARMGVVVAHASNEIAGEAPVRIPSDLLQRVTDAEAEADYIDIIKEITRRSLLPKGSEDHIEAPAARVAKELMGEARQTRRQLREEEAAGKAGEPITVRIEYVSSWRDATTKEKRESE